MTSAPGTDVTLKDRIARDGTFQFQVQAKSAVIATAPPAPVVATVVLGQSPAAATQGRCGRIRFGRASIAGRTARYYP